VVVVDSSVLIASFRGAWTDVVRRYLDYARRAAVMVGDIVLLEVLRGARNADDAMNIERRLRSFYLVPMLSADLAVEAAANYRLLRGLGITIRKVPDLIIGTYCIEHGHSLLHDDRDFEPMREHLGLLVA
jgi:predicted nucleic acid-binding protein